MTTAEEKKALRRELIARRKAMPPEEKARADERIFRQLVPLCEKAGSVFVYASTPIEADTRRIIDFCLEKGIKTALPVSGDTELTFYYISSQQELKTGRYGIDEPVCRNSAAIPDENTLCIVPALCADGNGLRMGYGKGYYDRFLSDFCGKSVIICYRSFKMKVPSEVHDKAADYTIFD